jgi:sugar phosphate isomerase/epimerase
MRRALSAMDLWFSTSTGTYPFDVRCEMLAELGYDGIAPTLWTDEAWAVVPRLGEVRDRFGLDVTGVFAYLEGPDDAEGCRRVERLLEELEGCRRVELGILSGGAGVPPSAPQGDDAVLPVLERLVAAAGRRSLALSLYPHQSWWLQRTADALRLAERLQHPSLWVVFSGYHWYAADGGDLGACLDAAASLLDSVSVAGASRPGRPPAVTRLDEGELDNFALLGELRRVGYRGPLHVFGYGVGGDVYDGLRRSLVVLRDDIEERLDRHPDWRADTSAVFPYLPAVMDIDEQREEQRA